MTIGQHYDKQQVAQTKQDGTNLSQPQEPSFTDTRWRIKIRELSVELTAAADKCEIVSCESWVWVGEKGTRCERWDIVQTLYFSSKKKRVFRYLQTCSMERRCPDKSKYTHNTQHSLCALGERKGWKKRRKQNKKTHKEFSGTGEKWRIDQVNLAEESC